MYDYIYIYVYVCVCFLLYLISLHGGGSTQQLPTAPQLGVVSLGSNIDWLVV